jgi:uncharacterized protein YndB with AHSA1/START domain
MTITGILTVSASGDRDIVMTRAFYAPRHLLYDAWTKPELVQRWLGVRNGWVMEVCEIDLRVGGAYRFVWRHETKQTHLGLRGVYREIVPPERLVCTEMFDEPWFSGESLITTVLEERDGVTTLTSTVRCRSTDAREAVLKSGMERGVAESYDKLAELLSTPENPKAGV